MVSVDTVYQKVLALANKEQRGYITPQEFNLLASEAQDNIFESYFNSDKRKLHNEQLPMGDELDLLEEKMNEFYTTTTSSLAIGVSSLTLPTDFYKLDIMYTNEGEVTELSRKEALHAQNNPLTQATTKRPTYVKGVNSVLDFYPTLTVATDFIINYWRRPNTTPNWNYVVVNGKALFNAGTSTNFELHSSEQELLVAKILEYAGITIQKPDLQQTALMNSQLIKSEQNKR
mgnify:FL=1|tara:strand:+ start:223 stop:915 length:693 start_codon:yes stop_codon:yes gene_type:complete